MPVRTRVLLFAICATAAALIVALPASAGSSGFFKTPSGNIVCQWESGPSVPTASVVCGVKSGLKPPVPKAGPACAHLDYVGNRVSLSATGPAHPIACAGDAGPFASPSLTKVLPYGHAWNGVGIRCLSSRLALVCRNRSGHGFFLSRPKWHTL